MDTIHFDIIKKGEFDRVIKTVRFNTRYGKTIIQTYAVSFAEDGTHFLKGEADEIVDLLNDGLRYRKQYDK